MNPAPQSNENAHVFTANVVDTVRNGNLDELHGEQHYDAWATTEVPSSKNAEQHQHPPETHTKSHRYSSYIVVSFNNH